MDIPGSSTSDATNICTFCNGRKRIYTCPRCGIGYCSAECYKSEAHSDCSESFYKQCVEEELKSSELDPEARKRMIEILKRTHEQDFGNDLSSIDGSDNEGSELDSDDHEEIPDLETRLENVNLDNADELWSALCESERQEFTALIRNGEVDKLLPEWVPWWTLHREKKLVEVIEDTEEADDCKEDWPTVIDVPPCSAIQKASPTVKYNLLNVIYAYAYMALYYNGDYLSCTEDATVDFLSICENMRNNKVYSDSASAFESVIENVKNCEWLPKDEQMTLAAKASGDLILQCPEADQSLHICRALSELHRLVTATKNHTGESKEKSKEFTNKFARRSEAPKLNLSKKSLLLHRKKLEYYISWAKVYHNSI